MGLIAGTRSLPGGIPITGAYSISQESGQTASLAAGAVVWACQFTAANSLAIIERIRISAVTGAAITTGTIFDLQLFFARGFTAPYSVNNTNATLTGNNQKRRTNMATTGMGAIQICTTAGMTGATNTPDAQELARAQGFTNITLGADWFAAFPISLWDASAETGSYPLILAPNEGLIIQAPLVGPITGSGAIVVEMDWMETNQF